MLHAFTVDVEDYYHVSAFESHVERACWSEYDSRVERSTHRILDLLDDFQTLGTFFVLGWVAQRFPRLVAEINDRGHEIGSHSFWHRLVYRLTPAQFRSDLRQARDLLEDISGQKVVAYRAPSFSITNKSLWALEVMTEEGFEIDSSVFPTYHDRYGIPNAERKIHNISTPAGSLIEFPPSVLRVGRINLPVSGGGYFRAKPWAVYRRLASSCITASNHPLMFYVHPWEVDPEQPDIGAGTKISRFRHYLNLDKTMAKLRRLLAEWDFGTVSEVLAKHNQIQTKTCTELVTT